MVSSSCCRCSACEWLDREHVDAAARPAEGASGGGLAALSLVEAAADGGAIEQLADGWSGVSCGGDDPSCTSEGGLGRFSPLGLSLGFSLGVAAPASLGKPGSPVVGKRAGSRLGNGVGLASGGVSCNVSAGGGDASGCGDGVSEPALRPELTTRESVCSGVGGGGLMVACERLADVVGRIASGGSVLSMTCHTEEGGEEARQARRRHGQ